jgi:hypothetical protein
MYICMQSYTHIIITHIIVAYHALRNVVTRSVATIEVYNTMDCVRNTHTPK